MQRAVVAQELPLALAQMLHGEAIPLPGRLPGIPRRGLTPRRRPEPLSTFGATARHSGGKGGICGAPESGGRRPAADAWGQRLRTRPPLLGGPAQSMPLQMRRETTSSRGF